MITPAQIAVTAGSAGAYNTAIAAAVATAQAVPNCIVNQVRIRRGARILVGAGNAIGATTYTPIGAPALNDIVLNGTYTGFGAKTFTVTCISNTGSQVQGVIVGTFVIGEAVTDGLGSIGTVAGVFFGSYLLIDCSAGTFAASVVITGGTSGAVLTRIGTSFTGTDLFTFTNGTITLININGSDPSISTIEGIKYTIYPALPTGPHAIGDVWTAAATDSMVYFGTTFYKTT